MKKIIVVLMVVFGIMSMVSCENGTTSGGGDSLIGTWVNRAYNGDVFEFTFKNNGTISGKTTLINGGGSIFTATFTYTENTFTTFNEKEVDNQTGLFNDPISVTYNYFIDQLGRLDTRNTPKSIPIWAAFGSLYERK